jgi:hypothetical protein
MHLAPLFTPEHDRHMRRHPLFRLALLALIILAALATTGVALAQSSVAYDLACRGVLDSGGGQSTGTGGNVGVIGAIGQSPAGAARSTNYGVRGGYIQPSSPPAVAAAPAMIAADSQTGRTLLPFLGKVMRVVRGGC